MKNKIIEGFKKLAKLKTAHPVGLTQNGQKDVVIVESRNPSLYKIIVGINDVRETYDSYAEAKVEAQKIIETE